MDLNLKLKQGQNLTAHMLQSVEILQMGVQELLAYIQNAILENPFLEVDESPAEDGFELMRRKLEWLESTDFQKHTYQHQEMDEDDTDPLANYGEIDDGEDLYHYVLAQLRTLELEKELAGPAEFIIESLDQNGWLDEDIPQLAAAFDCDEKWMVKALTLVQTLEPAGIGARNLSECLCLQLVRRGETGAPLRLAGECLNALAKNQYGLIARTLGITQDEAREAGVVIRSLNPRPGASFAARENLSYLIPDLIVVSFPNYFELLTNDYYIPALRLSSFYQHLFRECGDAEVKEYLSDKLSHAKWAMRAIEGRRSTLLACGERILARQESFFRRGKGHLTPMTLADVAEDLGIHESTVSRAVRDKYLQCSMGVYPLSYFFSRSLPSSDGARGGAWATPDGAKMLLKQFISREDPRKPLSDQKLCNLMAQEGYALARRTVAKYRDELGIPGTAGRTKRE